jgi:mRNA-degrading endonuclease RelE of RelBE toxin-antitoxin system
MIKLFALIFILYFAPAHAELTPVQESKIMYSYRKFVENNLSRIGEEDVRRDSSSTYLIIDSQFIDILSETDVSYEEYCDIVHVVSQDLGIPLDCPTEQKFNQIIDRMKEEIQGFNCFHISTFSINVPIPPAAAANLKCERVTHGDERRTKMAEKLRAKLLQKKSMSCTPKDEVGPASAVEGATESSIDSNSCEVNHPEKAKKKKKKKNKNKSKNIGLTSESVQPELGEKPAAAETKAEVPEIKSCVSEVKSDVSEAEVAASETPAEVKIEPVLSVESAPLAGAKDVSSLPLLLSEESSSNEKSWQDYEKKKKATRFLSRRSKAEKGSSSESESKEDEDLSQGWTVELPNKFKKESQKLSAQYQEKVDKLISDLRILGPKQWGWPKFGPIKRLENVFHCHLDGSDVIVAMWAVDRETRTILMIEVGSHPNMY